MLVNTNLNVFGKFLLVLSAFMLAPLAISLAYRQPDAIAFATSAFITAFVGIGLTLLFKHGNRELAIRDGFLLVGLTWLGAGVLGALPFLLSGSVPSFIDAVFESVSGFTTTGATVFTTIENKPLGILFWRSLSHWLGGMGIIVLSVAFLPKLGAGAMQLFRAEVPGPSAEKLLPRIKDTAKVLWLLYTALTVLLVLALLAAGMSWFDAVCHAMSTLGTGGFSTRDLSVASYASPWIDIILTLFMIAAGANFTLYYYLYNRRWSLVKDDRELRFYLAVVTIAGAVIAVDLLSNRVFTSLFTAVRHSFFQVASLVTTTGFFTADFNRWPPLSQAILMTMEFFGGSAGSTAGALKMIRVLILLKFSSREFYRLLHPRLVRPVRVGSRVIPEEMLDNVAGFTLLYFLVFLLAGLLVTGFGVDVLSAFTGAAATLGNVGPGLNLLGPLGNFSPLPGAAKLVYILCMLLGRLELFTFILFLGYPFVRLGKLLKSK